MENFEFEVGSTYENEKGPYEVLSVNYKNDNMVIRWEDGKEISTSLDFQQCILERRQQELEFAEAKRLGLSLKGRRGSSARRGKFDGFKDTDFSGGVSGTSWRKQGKLGGAVTAMLPSKDLRINSWAVSRLPEVHWKDVKHHELQENSLQAKFFTRLDKDNLYCGFFIERPDKKSDTKDDWKNFFEWLKVPDNETWLKEVAGEYGLLIYDKQSKKRSFKGEVSVVNGNWCLIEGDKEKEITSLAGFCDQLSNSRQVDLQIAKVIGKDEVLERQEKIAKDISQVFDVLMPIYRATVTIKQ